MELRERVAAMSEEFGAKLGGLPGLVSERFDAKLDALPGLLKTLFASCARGGNKNCSVIFNSGN